ncbi:hypothetical protein P4C99_11635 [Pontiellaceae bacterium B1224]|nr:hypothetical protein [Pontiellaceae bacterium B1224]
MKKTQHSIVAHPLRTTSGLLATLLILALPYSSLANLDMTLTLERNSGEFEGSVYLSTYGDSTPETYHRVESPNGIIFQNSDWSDFSNTNLSFSALLAECTNGLWSLVLNVGDVSEKQYAFSVGIMGVTSNMFGDTTITNPVNYAVISTNQPLIEWTSTSLLPQVHIQVHNGFQAPEPGNYVNLAAPINSWTPASPVLAGDNTIFISYQSNDFSGITISHPTNSIGGTSVSNWNASAVVESTDFSYFTAPDSGGSPLGEALEAPQLNWNTDASDGYGGWFPQSEESNDGTDAAQSGSPSPYEASWIETTVQGPGTLSFWWNIIADGDDYVEFSIYNSDFEYEDGERIYGEHGDSWDYFEIELPPGENDLSWTFYNDDPADENYYNAAFLDEVTFIPELTASIVLEFQRTLSEGISTFSVYPFTQNASASAEIESPTGLCSSDDSGSSSAIFASLQDAIDECVAGYWTISFDGGLPYEFTVTVNSLTTNDIPKINLVTPAHGSSGVSADTDYAWGGTTDYSSTYVSVALLGAPTNSASASLSGTATNWLSGTTLNAGTNRFYVTQSLNSFSGVDISDPGLSSWTAETRLTTRASSDFIVGGIIPLSVTILPPEIVGGDLSLSFFSQSGATHIVEWSTNLVSGPWLPATNFPGDGTTNLVILPTTYPAAYYQIKTQ